MYKTVNSVYVVSVCQKKNIFFFFLLNFDWFYVFVNFEINPKKKNCNIELLFIW